LSIHDGVKQKLGEIGLNPANVSIGASDMIGHMNTSNAARDTTDTTERLTKPSECVIIHLAE